MYGCDPWKDKEDAIERRLDQLEGRNIDHDQALLDLQVEADNDRAAMEAYASAMLTDDAFNDAMLVVSDELETKIPISDKGVPEGVATLDMSGKVPSSQIPAVPVALRTFTNSALGGIKGSTTAGRISANADGTGSVNGWDTKANVNGQVFTGNLQISKATEGVLNFIHQKNINGTWGRFMWIQVFGLLNGVNKQIGEILHTHSKLNDTNYTTTLGLNLTTNYNDVDHTHYTGPRMNIANGVPERYFIFETRVNSQSTDGVNYSQLLSAQSDTITTVANTYARADAVGAVNGIAGLDAAGKVPTGQLPARAISDITGLQTTLDGKQDSLTFDDAPVSGSNNPVKSGGVYDALTTKADTPEWTYGSGTLTTNNGSCGYNYAHYTIGGVVTMRFTIGSSVDNTFNVPLPVSVASAGVQCMGIGDNASFWVDYNGTGTSTITVNRAQVTPTERSFHMLVIGHPSGL